MPVCCTAIGVTEMWWPTGNFYFWTQSFFTKDEHIHQPSRGEPRNFRFPLGKTQHRLLYKTNSVACWHFCQWLCPLVAYVCKGFDSFEWVSACFCSKQTSIKWYVQENMGLSVCLAIMPYQRLQDETQTPLPLITEVWEDNMMSF